MEITRRVFVTIETDSDDVMKCNLTCSQAEECRFCRRFGENGNDGIGGYEFSHNDDKRHPACLAEFGTGDVVNSSVKLIDCPVCKGRGRWEFRPQNWVPCQTCRRTGVVEVVVSDKQVAEFGTGEGENG